MRRSHRPIHSHDFWTAATGSCSCAGPLSCVLCAGPNELASYDLGGSLSLSLSPKSNRALSGQQKPASQPASQCKGRRRAESAAGSVSAPAASSSSATNKSWRASQPARRSLDSGSSAAAEDDHERRSINPTRATAEASDSKPKAKPKPQQKSMPMSCRQAEAQAEAPTWPK